MWVTQFFLYSMNYITLHIVALLSALNIVFHIINICYMLFGGHGGGAGYEGYVIGSIVALILFCVYLVLYRVKKLMQSKSFRYVHILCITNFVLYLIVWIYLIAYTFKW